MFLSGLREFKKLWLLLYCGKEEIHSCNILNNKREITSDAIGVTALTTSGGFGQ